MTYRFIGYAIVSDDGMLADASGRIPPSLIVTADQDFFMRGLDAAAALVHGRNSAEQPTSPTRRRLITTHKVAALEKVTGEPNALLWNPAGASVEEALQELGVREGDIAIVGGTDIFGLFLPRYDQFYLTQAHGVTLPGGVAVFPGVPGVTPESLLVKAGMTAGQPEILDATRDVRLVPWQRSHTA
ncbi:MAG: dihydrofolate reductase [Pseudorhodoplanes sp.]